MKTSVIGFPRIGALRELKFAEEKYFKGEMTADELEAEAKKLRLEHWQLQKGIDFIPSNDFSLYDNLLDTAVLFNIVPERYKKLGLPPLDTYFAMARGYQGEKGDVKALAMKKWFNTNYHYIVPEFEDTAKIELCGTKPFDEFVEAKEAGINTVPALIGPFTLLKLTRFTGSKGAEDIKTALMDAYKAALAEFAVLGAEWVSLAEPYLVTDLSKEEIILFKEIYQNLLAGKKAKINIQTYFGDVRDCAEVLDNLDIDGIGLDFNEGEKSLELVKKFSKEKTIFAGVVNGKNIWKNNYEKTAALIESIKNAGFENIVVSTSCSLLHVPFTTENETKLPEKIIKYFSFAKEKLAELLELKDIFNNINNAAFNKNKALFAENRDCTDEAVQKRTAAITQEMYTRLPVFEEREKLQKAKLALPLLPTTTIGSFPQTSDVKKNRSQFKNGEIGTDEYVSFNKRKIKECMDLQEKLGLDVLVHGEFERNDMVEYFGENLNGYIFTEKAWVQSYGTRCVKPPVIWGDISRKAPITVEWSKFAASLTKKPVKGMLTGPVTILNWSFPREDISLKESALQIALAIRDEVLDLEKSGIKIIQIDEAALREKLPLRKTDRYSGYLDWAIPAFRLVHSGAAADTQIHTHMCYSEFKDIIKAIDDMDADVITFEASRSDLQLLDCLNENNFKTEVGPGVYDIHSPRVPAVEEIESALRKMLLKIDKQKLWVNPDCGLKTRGSDETVKSLENMVKAAKNIRKNI
ncbi:MAG: 5-methyltetrahydropteroyltriglutamate--homocysteine S-methyltransferase [Firmicutes bacterium]|nr:5-methyltetrahydropteroyltriglutamate--homocysteine S-methyltransferase [Bacillota bacterium]